MVTAQHVIQQLEFRYQSHQPAIRVHHRQLIDAILAHCELPGKGFEVSRAEFARKLSLPDYYPQEFSADDLGLIAHHCEAVNDKLSTFCQIT